MITHCRDDLRPITYLWTGMNWSFLLAGCTVVFCVGTQLARGTPCKHLHNTYFILCFSADTLLNIILNRCKHRSGVMSLPNCTFLQFLASLNLLLNVVRLSSVVRAMQGLMVMPGSMALDKDLGKAEQDTRQTKSVSLLNTLIIHPRRPSSNQRTYKLRWLVFDQQWGGLI